MNFRTNKMQLWDTSSILLMTVIILPIISLTTIAAHCREQYLFQALPEGLNSTSWTSLEAPIRGKLIGCLVINMSDQWFTPLTLKPSLHTKERSSRETCLMGLHRDKWSFLVQNNVFEVEQFWINALTRARSSCQKELRRVTAGRQSAGISGSQQAR